MFRCTPEWGKSTTNGKGFQMKFANGWVVSVQWGQANYCEVRSFGCKEREVALPSPNAECMVWREVGGKTVETMRLTANDDVQGWMTPEEVSKLIATVAEKE